MKMRRAEGRYFHWCPACNTLHQLPDTWKFNGNLESPTFMPSFKQSDGTERICHYNISEGEIVFHGDSSHGMAGKTVPMPEIPVEQP